MRFFKQNGETSAATISNKIDFDRVFEGLTEAIEESPMGAMLGMLGGKEALQPLKEPVTEKLKGIIAELASEKHEGGEDFTSSLIKQVEEIIDSRLQELTPEKVKEIVQNIIRKHLGWLVVWGGVFGGIIGLGVSLINI